MSDIPTKAIASFCAVVGIAIAGCGDVSPPQSAQVPTGNETPKAENPGSEKDRSPTYITCRARLTAFEKDHPWFDESGAGHDDGKAPLASFVLVEPVPYGNRAVDILFKYSNADAASSPDQTDIGSEFALQIPADFLSGNFKTLDNTSVRRLHKVEQSTLPLVNKASSPSQRESSP